MDNNKNEVIFGDFTKAEDIFGDPIEVSAEVEKEKEKVSTEVDLPKGTDIFGDEIELDLETATDKELEVDKAVEEVEKKVDKGSTNVNYLSRVKELVAQGIWEDFEELDELEDLTEEEYEEIKKAQKEMLLEEAKNSVLGVLDEEEKEFLEYKKTGGDLEKFTTTYIAQKKVQEIDITSDNGKKAAVYEYYTNVLDYPREKAIRKIEALVKDLDLDDEAEFAYEKITANAKEEHNRVIAENKARVDYIKKAEEEYKSGLKTSLKEKVKDNKKVNQIFKTLTERDERGFTDIDKKFLALRNNPEQAEFLYNVLFNTEDFLKTVVTEKTNEEKQKVMQSIKFKKRSASDVVETKKSFEVDL